MGFEGLTRTFPWKRYSKCVQRKIEKPHNAGIFEASDVEARGMRLITGEAGAFNEGNVIKFFWMVDPEDGTIIDVKFSAVGQSALIGAADSACDLLVGKNYDQAIRLGADLIDRNVRDHSNTPAFPPETGPHLNLVLEAIDATAVNCEGIPLPQTYSAPPTPGGLGEITGDGYPGWETLTAIQKKKVIEEVLDQEIRPYIALDGGGVELVDFVEEKQVVIAYQGNCTSCFSAVGATLSYIQQVMQAKIHPNLTVVPELSSISFGDTL